ncbi:hypothetical protein [Gorillibacterium sp. sgz500922]|uniref:hypothetical protein n=1 Tax=Gorillibacterium sp. sgz500922 TaxID=3446694 RepID=UPI003F663D16
MKNLLARPRALLRSNTETFLNKQEGSVTLEAAMVYPLILLLTFLLLFIALSVWRTSELELRADAAAERAAFNWDNSYRDPVTGAYPVPERDGLYWRLSLGEISSLFRLSGNSSGKLAVPASGNGGLTLNQRKLYVQAKTLSADIGGELTYRSSLLERSVQADLHRDAGIPSFLVSLMPDRQTRGAAVSYIAEPAEFLRNLDLLTGYASRLRDYLSKKDEVGSLDAFSEDKPAPYIDEENDAKIYIQELVNGKPKVIKTYPIGTERRYDAIDSDGIAHDAKYNLRKELALEEIKKDVELIKRGEIKGCVWHFFQIKRNNKGADLTPSLRAELEKNGITVVIHQL